ncbi:hypothetical protein OCA97_14735 [Bacillus cereus]|nr:hypothetical protein [Bacillus cereus]
MYGKYFEVNCIENRNDSLELYVTEGDLLNIEILGGSKMVLLDVKKAKKLKKALKQYIKSQELIR